MGLSCGKADAGLLAKRELLRRQPDSVALLLGGVNEGRYGAQALVLDDGTLVDLGVLVEEGVGKLASLAVDLEP
jgi:hypothetical protein